MGETYTGMGISKRNLFWGAVIVFVVLVAVALYFLFSNRSQKKPEPLTFPYVFVSTLSGGDASQRFPAGIVPEGVSITKAEERRLPDGTGVETIIKYSQTGKPVDVINGFEKKLTSLGWTLQVKDSKSPQALLSMQKGKQFITITAQDDKSGKSNIGLTLKDIPGN